MAKQKYYNGTTPSSKFTSIAGGASPAIKWLHKNGYLSGCGHSLDFGCGRTARNSEWLAEQGVRVFRYDPYWGDGGDDRGWLKGKISMKLPNFQDFHYVFSSFVLNVVTKSDQDDIIKACKKIAPYQIHIVRNDVITAAQKALDKKDPIATAFRKKHLNGGSAEELARFGFVTKKGFQRQIDEIKGYSCIKETSSYRIFIN